MSPRRPEVFVSATSSDLRTCRQLVKEALLTLGCVPVEQTNFAPDYRSVAEMLRHRIATCDAIVHLAGEVYGAEPRDRKPDEPRRSYTQMEYHIARELGKPVYLFICGDGFPYDPHPTEDPEKQELQRAHRAALTKTSQLYYRVHSHDDLGLRVRELQTQVEHLSRELRKTRSWLGRGVAAGLIVAALLGGGVWWVSQRTTATEQRLQTVESELDRQRRYIQAVADAYTQQQAELAQLRLTDEEQFNRAVAAVARRENIPEDQLRSGITLFVAAVRTDAAASFMDRALAEFAQQNFAAAAAEAGQAGAAAREQRLAAEQLAARAAEEVRAAAAREREAFSLQGQALYARNDYKGAVEAFTQALEAAPREGDARAWADVQRQLAKAWDDWADHSEGADIHVRRERAIALFREVLAVVSPQSAPAAWGFVQNHLGNALRSRALEALAPSPDLAAAAEAFEAALTVRTEAAAPQDWAATRNNLGILARDRALDATGPERARLFAEAEAHLRAALTVRDPQSQPVAWAGLQENLGLLLDDRADEVTGAERSRLRQASRAALQAAVDVVPRSTHAREWAQVQGNLAVVLLHQAYEQGGDARRTTVQAAVAAATAALQVYTRATHPQDWARVQGVLADARAETADELSAAERLQLWDDLASLYRGTLQVETRAALPVRWVSKQIDLAEVLQRSAKDSVEPDRSRRLQEAEAACRSALEILDQTARPFDWLRSAETLAAILTDQAWQCTGEERRSLFAEVVDLRRAVSRQFPRATLPLRWATAQVDLADALDNLASELPEPERSQLRREAVEACGAALEVQTRDELPLEWARTQDILAYILSALRDDATSGDHGKLHADVLSARRAILEVHTRDAFPREWAGAQLDLADAFWIQGRYYAEDEERFEAFAGAAAACEAAMSVFSKEAVPGRWADAQRMLALALSGQAAGRSGDEARVLQEREIAALRAALEVDTREASPLRWAQTRRRLAGALSRLAFRHGESEAAAAVAEEAVATYRSVMEVFTRKDAPREWAETQDALADTLSRAAWTTAEDDPRQLALWSEVISARQAVRESFGREEHPVRWAEETSDLATALAARGGITLNPDRDADLRAALSEWRASLAAYTAEAYPAEWKFTHRELGRVLIEWAETKQEAERSRLREEGIAAYRAGLGRDLAIEPGLERTMRQELADALRTHADAAEGEVHAGRLRETVAAYRAAVDMLDPHEPLRWALYRARLAESLVDLAATVPADDRLELLEEAIAHCRTALEVRESSAINAALCDLHLGRALLEHAATLEGAKRQEQLREAAHAGRGAMAVITPDLSADYHALATRVVREAEAAAGE